MNLAPRKSLGLDHHFKSFFPLIPARSTLASR